MCVFRTSVLPGGIQPLMNQVAIARRNELGNLNLEANVEKRERSKRKKWKRKGL